ncbi:sulfite exporter TauE/SafE family protein [Crenobacter cavernae]|uniref:Probable membrane transporter protein n=1 Tax=Crenobacter cavernae TaxID=2290923 RepID=A0A345Y1Z3_9NEIS|nr:sulfite exporter TauE/SafE family protein [Crenobacter cavernae]AXK37945.1 sulfite exporter TauE/SafE family protein [Crenobacter cavernae]AXK40759.1 sulfite exporter TauE/SafE family protein [Crenobacter cavernae]AXK40766.1 sulfite exporter TauE/SafE family protein [Crenobacter cavernae]
MTGEMLLPFLALMGVASYFQTVTGFGLGMIVMGATSGLNLAPVASVAAVVSLVTLANSAVALPGKLHHIDWRAVRAATFGILPSIVAGVLLLDYLSSAASDLLQLLLGAVILYGGLGSALRPAPLKERSGDGSFFVSGVFGGLLSGMFGVSGPPLIFQFYRQPMTLVEIRCVLILVFTVTSSTRTLFTAYQGQLTADIWMQSALAVPVVALATIAARRYPPPLSATTTRRVAFIVLMLIGCHLMFPALLQLIGEATGGR